MKRPYISMEERKWYRDYPNTLTASSFWVNHYSRQVFKKGILDPYERFLKRTGLFEKIFQPHEKDESK